MKKELINGIMAEGKLIDSEMTAKNLCE